MSSVMHRRFVIPDIPCRSSADVWCRLTGKMAGTPDLPHPPDTAVDQPVRALSGTVSDSAV